jgi:hypothetical protein
MRYSIADDLDPERDTGAWAIAFMGYAAGAFPPCRTSFSDFLKAAHTLALAQAGRTAR